MAIKDLEVKITCPLGSECEQIKTYGSGEKKGEQYIERCSWYVEMKGVDASGDEHNTSKCSMHWLPILQLETSSVSRSITDSVVSLRDEVVNIQNSNMNRDVEHTRARMNLDTSINKVLLNLTNIDNINSIDI